MYLSPSNSPSQYVWLRLLIMSLVPFLFPCVWFWQIHGLSAGGIFKYMANVSFHACALICWVFKTNLEDGRKRRGQAFFLRPGPRRKGRERDWGSENESEGKGSRRKGRRLPAVWILTRINGGVAGIKPHLAGVPERKGKSWGPRRGCVSVRVWA